MFLKSYVSTESRHFEMPSVPHQRSRPTSLADSMQGLNLTYDTLGNTRNEAAVDVLLAALSDEDSATRRHALNGFLSRQEEKSPEQVLAHWHLLQPDDLRILRPRNKWIAKAIEKALRQSGEEVDRAIDAATSIGLHSAIPQLAMLAESSGSRAQRMKATDAVIELVEPLGRNARADRDQPTVRNPVLARLADSVRRFSMHKNHKLIDAFLLLVTWGDADFRQLLSEKSAQLDLLAKRLRDSQLAGINDLVAGFLRRRNIPDPISAIIQERDQVEFRDALLRTVGNEPSATVIRNLNGLGLPQSCVGGESLMREIPAEYRSALTHIYAATDHDPLDKLHVIATAVECGGPAVAPTAAICLSRSEIPSAKIWMRAAVPVANGDQEAIESDPNARLLQRLIDLLDHPEPGLVRGVRHVLSPLHAEEMLDRFESLRPRSRRKIGKIVMMIDPDAIDRIRDALRHPVLKNRLAAIATADALAAVDLLCDSFTHISRQDHQEARIRAADVMASANGEVTLDLLREMVDLPESPVRDAAVDALQRREQAVT